MARTFGAAGQSVSIDDSGGDLDFIGSAYWGGAWVARTANTAQDAIISTLTAGFAGWEFGFNASGRQFGLFQNGPGWNEATNASMQFPVSADETWHFVGWYHDGADLHFWFDDNKQTTLSVAGPSGAGDSTKQIGRRSPTAANEINAHLAEVFVGRGALADADALMAALFAGARITDQDSSITSALELHAPMNEASGAPIDQGPNGLTLSLDGNPAVYRRHPTLTWPEAGTGIVDRSDLMATHKSEVKTARPEWLALTDSNIHQTRLEADFNAENAGWPATGQTIRGGHISGMMGAAHRLKILAGTGHRGPTAGTGGGAGSVEGMGGLAINTGAVSDVSYDTAGIKSWPNTGANEGDRHSAATRGIDDGTTVDDVNEGDWLMGRMNAWYTPWTLEEIAAGSYFILERELPAGPGAEGTIRPNWRRSEAENAMRAPAGITAAEGTGTKVHTIDGATAENLPFDGPETTQYDLAFNDGSDSPEITATGQFGFGAVGLFPSIEGNPDNLGLMISNFHHYGGASLRDALADDLLVMDQQQWNFKWDQAWAAQRAKGVAKADAIFYIVCLHKGNDQNEATAARAYNGIAGGGDATGQPLSNTAEGYAVNFNSLVRVAQDSFEAWGGTPANLRFIDYPYHRKKGDSPFHTFLDAAQQEIRELHLDRVMSWSSAQIFPDENAFVENYAYIKHTEQGQSSTDLNHLWSGGARFTGGPLAGAEWFHFQVFGAVGLSSGGGAARNRSRSRARASSLAGFV